jgi:hypothetical protein
MTEHGPEVMLSSTLPGTQRSSWLLPAAPHAVDHVVTSVHGTQDQCEVLTTRLGVIPEVTHVVRHLWFSLLPLTGHLDFDPNKRWVRECSNL